MKMPVHERISTDMRGLNDLGKEGRADLGDLI